MKHLTILVPEGEGNNLSSIVGSYKIFTRANEIRRFIKATGNSPLEYIQRAKVEAAKRTLEYSRKTISEIMYDVGYSDVKAFREIFKKITGLTPTAYKEKYRKEVLVN